MNYAITSIYQGEQLVNYMQEVLLLLQVSSYLTFKLAEKMNLKREPMEVVGQETLSKKIPLLPEDRMC
jgi:hypothetical protein